MQDNKDSLNKNYIDVIYDVSSKPITDYPHKLTKHLKERFDIDEKKFPSGDSISALVSGVRNC